MSTYDWTTIGTEVVPLQHRAEFLAHLRGEITRQPDLPRGPEGVLWLAPTGSHPQRQAVALMAVVREFEIAPVVKVAYNLTWQADQNTRKPGPGPDAEVLGIVAVQSDTEAMYFVDRGFTVTPILIERLPDEADDLT